MLICTTCGRNLEDVRIPFEILRDQRVKQYMTERNYKNIQMAQIYCRVEMPDVFEMLGIPKERYCCRGTLTSRVDIRKKLRPDAP